MKRCSASPVTRSAGDNPHIDFASACWTGVSSELSGLKKKFAAGQLSRMKHIRENTDVVQSLINIAISACLVRMAERYKVNGLLLSIYRQEEAADFESAQHRAGRPNAGVGQLIMKRVQIVMNSYMRVTEWLREYARITPKIDLGASKVG